MNKKGIPDWLLKARDKWTFNGQQRPDFAQVPKDGQVSVWDFPRPPALKSVSKKLEVRYQGTLLALSHNALAVLETASPPTYYVPPEEVNLELLTRMEGENPSANGKGPPRIGP